MNSELKRFHDRFQDSFDGGMVNVKFFVRSAENVAFSDFVKEVNMINDTIAAGEFRVVTSIDGDFETRAFDDAF